MATTVSELQAKFTADTSGLEAGAKRAQGAVSGMGSTLKTALGTGAGFLMAGLVQGLASGVGQLASAGLSFEQQMANVDSIAKLSAADLDTLKQQVIAISSDPRILAGPAELAAGLYEVSSSGFKGADALTIVQQAAMAATAGLTTSDVAARAITSSLNAYGLGADQAQRVSDVLFQTVNSGVITFDQLANNLGNTLPLANALGINIESLGASYALMTLKGVSAAQAETQIAALMRSAINPTTALTEAVTAQGFASAESAISTLGFGGFLELLMQASGGSKEALADMLGTTEAVNAALILGANGGADYNEMLAEMEGATDGAGATQKALERQMKSARFAIAEMRKQVEIVAVVLMGLLAPAISVAAQWISRFISGAMTFVGEMMQMTSTGNVFTDTWLRKFPDWAQPAIEALMGIVTAGMDVVDAFQDLMRGDVGGFFDELQEAARTAWDAISELASTTLDWVLNTGIPAVTGWIVDNADDIWSGIKSLVGWAWNGLADLGKWTLSVGAPGIVGGITSITGRLGAWLLEQLTGGGGGVMGDGTGGPSPYGSQGVSATIGSLKIAIQALAFDAGSALGTAIRNLVSSIRSQLTNVDWLTELRSAMAGSRGIGQTIGSLIREGVLTVAELLGDINWSRVANAIVSGLPGAIKALLLAPALIGGAILGIIGSAVRGLVEGLTGTTISWDGVAGAITGAIRTAISGFPGFAENIKGALIQEFNESKPSTSDLVGIASAAASALADAIPSAIRSFVNFAAGVKSQLVQEFRESVPSAGELADIASAIVGALWDAMRSAATSFDLSDLWSWGKGKSGGPSKDDLVSGAIGDGGRGTAAAKLAAIVIPPPDVSQFQAGLAKLAPMAQQAISATRAIIQFALSQIPPQVRGLAAQTTAMWQQSLAPMPMQTGAIAMQTAQSVTRALSPLPGQAGQYGRGAAQGFLAGLSSIQSAGGIVSGAMSSVRGAMASASYGAYSYGAAVGNQFAAGLRSSLGAVSSAAGALRALMPSSPAKKGPLSEPISWDYITDALALSMGDAVRVARQGTRDIHGAFGGSLAYQGRYGASGGTVVQHIYVLKSDEMLQIMRGAEQGARAYAQQGSRGREIAFGLRGV